MKQHARATKFVVALLMIVGVIGFSAFRQKQTKTNSFRTEQKAGDEDSSTRRKPARPADDKDLDKLEEAMKKLDKEMLELDEKMKKMDFSKIEKDVNESMKKIDMQKINLQVEEAMKKVDWEKMDKHIKESMSKLKEIDMKHVKESLAKVQQELAEQKHHFKIDGEQIRKQVEKSMEKAKESMAVAKEEIKNMQALTDALEAGGLIDKKKAYKVQVKDGELYINDVKQPKETSEKYKQYYRKENFTIQSGFEDGDRI